MQHTGITLPPGSFLQEYRIQSTLGMGGFGVTYLAVDTNLNLKVAIKEYLPGDLMVRGEDLTLRPRSEENQRAFDWGRGRFLYESRTLAAFRHPGIVRVLRFFEAFGTAYMVMEFVEGQTLQAWIKRHRPLPESTVLALAAPLLDGLETIHGAGYLHRDIKPNNIFIREDGSPVLLDFGSARVVDADSELTVVVSPGYAPLEQYHAHGHQGPWSDLYAFGGVLYWMVTGANPPEAPARVRHDPMQAAIAVGEHALYSDGLLKAIDWALAPAEEDRPQTVAAFREALRDIDPDPGSEVSTLFAATQRLLVQEASPYRAVLAAVSLGGAPGQRRPEADHIRSRRPHRPHRRRGGEVRGEARRQPRPGGGGRRLGDPGRGGPGGLREGLRRRACIGSGIAACIPSVGASFRPALRSPEQPARLPGISISPRRRRPRPRRGGTGAAPRRRGEGAGAPGRGQDAGRGRALPAAGERDREPGGAAGVSWTGGRAPVAGP
ncbi:MAG: serine/threonine protein kinase [Holophagaceae bacterium]|nr:serine/threonine protein kinase [Holophagaceae bacterium]